MRAVFDRKLGTIVVVMLMASVFGLHRGWPGWISAGLFIGGFGLAAWAAERSGRMSGPDMSGPTAGADVELHPRHGAADVGPVDGGGGDA